MACLVCGAGPDLGSLCRTCARDVAPCDGLIREHVRSSVDPGSAVAWAVDGFGAAHPLAAKTSIGRSNEGELIVLASSVSREHAELKRTDNGWTMRDLGSRNGTFVDGARVQGRVSLKARHVVKIGDVALWFLPDVEHEPTQAPSMATASVGAGLVRFKLASNDTELCLVGSTDPDAGGGLLAKAPGTDRWTEHNLPKLEYHLLRMLPTSNLRRIPCAPPSSSSSP